MGFRVWLISEGAAETELTSGTPVAVNLFSSGSNFTSTATNTWNFAGASVTFSYQALKVVMYSSIDGGTNWATRAIFLSNVLLTEELQESTWTFTYNINYTVSADTFIKVDWGGDNWNSGIAGVTLSDPDIYDVMMFKFSTFDILGFILYPYINLFGASFYLIVLVALFGAYYIWHGKSTVVLFMLVMFGAAGGLVWVLLPLPATLLAWALMAVSFAILLFKVFR